MRDRALHYSEDHRYVLAFCAERANRRLWDRYQLHVDPDELMSEGWWRCLRHAQQGQLKPAIHHTIRAMVDYAVSFYLVRGTKTRARAILALDDANSVDSLPSAEPDPESVCENTDLVEFLTYHIEPDLVRAGWHVLGDGWTLEEVAAREHVTNQAISYRKIQFVKRARALLEV